MRYKCGVCQVTVPIVLVRAHVARHPGRREGLEEEEWRNCSGLNKADSPLEAGETTRTALEVAETAKSVPEISEVSGKKTFSTEKNGLQETFLKKSAESQSRKQLADISLFRPSESLSVPFYPHNSPVNPDSHSPTRSSISPLTLASVENGKRRKTKRPAQGSVMDCIRKVRRVQLALERVEMANRRVLYMAMVIALSLPIVACH